MSLIELLERERRQVARLLSASGFGLTAGTVAALLALGAVLLGGARWLALPRAVPVLLWLAVVGFVVAGVRLVRDRKGRLATLAGVAGAVERERALRDGSLRGTVEVASSGALGRLGAEQMADRLTARGPGSLAPSLQRRMWRAVAAGAAGTLLGIAVLVSASALAPDGWAALLHPVRAWRGTLLEGVQLEGMPGAVLRGERLTVQVRAPGRREVTVVHRRTGASWRSSMVPVKDGEGSLRLDPVDADLTIVATDGRAVSDTARVRMVERPFIGDVTVRAQFPPYLRRQEEIIPLGEPARVPQGTQLLVEGQSSTELREVTLAHERRMMQMTISGRRFSGRMVAGVSGRYQWRATGVGGPIADVPPALELEVMPDSAPQVDILSPANDTTVNEGDSVAVSVLAVDDHGLASVEIRSWIETASGERLPAATRSHDGGGEAQWAGETILSAAPLRPGDELHVMARATDGSPWRLASESREIVLRLPTLSEQRGSVRDAADSAVARAAAVADAQKELQQRTSDASRERANRPTDNRGAGNQNNMSYESSEQARSLAQEQRQLANRMQELQSAARQLEQQLQATGTLDSALQSRLREVQKLLSDALTPELAEQLRKLEQASQQLSQEDARKALADLAQQQQRLREQLEKSVEMLKRAALEGSMSTLKDDAKELADRQRRLADSLGRSQSDGSRNESRREARALAERSRDISEEIQELQQRLEQEKAATGAERVGEAQRRARESAQSMERAAQQQAGERQSQPTQGEQRGQQASQQQNNQQRSQQQGTQQQGTQQQGAQQQGAQQQGSQQQGAQQQGRQGQQGNQQGRQGGQQQGAQQQGNQQGGQRPGDQDAESAARRASSAMEAAAQELQQARDQQVSEWKQELTTELDRSIQEMIQLAREQETLEQQARRGASPSELRPQQSTLQQGVEQSAQRLAEAGQRSSLLSQRSLRTVSDARKSVEEATRQTQAANNTPSQVASAMRAASEALNSAAASLVRDRERAESASSASGFAEMLQQLQQMAQQQSSLNSQAQQLIPRPGSSLDAQGQQQSRQLGREQREVAARLDDMADRDDSGRANELAREARQIAQALEAAQLDPGLLERQQRLFRKMLDAGRLLEEEEREDTGKREAKSWTGSEVFTPPGVPGSGRSATRFQPPTWNELRGLTPEERRLVLEYFKKINGSERP